MDLDTLPIDDCTLLMIDDHQAVITALRGARNELSRLIESAADRMRRGGRLIYLGAGTSGRLGVLDAAECPPTFQSEPEQVIGIIAGGDRSLRTSSESKEDDPDGSAAELGRLNIGPDDTLIGLAAGGTTPYVRGAIELASLRGATTALITCAAQAAPPPACDHFILLDTGPELLTGSTRLKAGSATKLALNIISTTLFVQLGKTYSNLMVDLRATNAKLKDRAIRILIELCPDLCRETASNTLDQAGGELKTAIVMHRLSLDRNAARQRLEATDGFLRTALR